MKAAGLLLAVILSLLLWAGIVWAVGPAPVIGVSVLIFGACVWRALRA